MSTAPRIAGSSSPSAAPTSRAGPTASTRSRRSARASRAIALGLAKHLCIPFNLEIPAYDDVPRSYDGLKRYLTVLDSRFAPGHLAEGIVFHHPDGRRAKIKRKDFASGRAQDAA